MSETKFIKRSECREVIESSNGRRFWVRFRKKDNTLRDMEAEVRPPKQSPNKPPSAYNPDLIVVGDRHVYKHLVDHGAEPEKAYDASYRSISVSTLQEFKIENQLYIVED
jgi:hypothetical protein